MPTTNTQLENHFPKKCRGGLDVQFGGNDPVLTGPEDEGLGPGLWEALHA